MNCLIPGVNLKVLSKAIQALSKIGDELQVEPQKDCLTIKATNMTTTALTTFRFLGSFFLCYEIEEEDKISDLTCVIPMKAVLSVFKPHGHKDKWPEICRIELKDTEAKIVFTFKYKYDVTVVRSLHLIDGQVINVNFNTSTVNQISANAHLFLQVLANFQLGDDDMSLEVYNNKALMRNYIVGEKNKMKGIRSQLALTIAEFSTFEIGQETSITFALKPFRSAVTFAESFNLSIYLHFERAGKPLIIIIRNPTFEVNFIIATISTDHISQSSLSTSVVLKKKQTERANITIQDQQALESVNWDNDLDVNGIQKGNPESDKNKSSLDLSFNNNLERIEHVTLSEQLNLDKNGDIICNSPDSPKTKRIKTVFGRCCETTFHPAIMDLGNVLASDSDPE